MKYKSVYSMKRRQFLTYFPLIPLTGISPFGWANSFDDFVKSQRIKIDQTTHSHQTYNKRYLSELESYKAALKQQWNKIEITNQEILVLYSDKLQKKTVIDYAFNEIRISYRSNADITTQFSLLKSLAKKDLRKLLNITEQQALESDPVNKEMMSGATSASQNDELLSDLISLYDNKTEASETLVSKAVIINENMPSTTQPIITIKIPLPTELLPLRPLKYLEIIVDTAKKWSIEPALVLAIAHTSSHFNSLAQHSFSPTDLQEKGSEIRVGFGLLQINPATQGKDASKFIYGTERLLTCDELYAPHTNIEIVCAYLNLIESRQLKNIADPESRFYCLIAAFHAGAGHVAKALIGQASMPRAFRIINQLTPEQVLKSLAQDLEDEQSNAFFNQVIDHLPTYRKLINDNY